MEVRVAVRISRNVRWLCVCVRETKKKKRESQINRVKLMLKACSEKIPVCRLLISHTHTHTLLESVLKTPSPIRHTHKGWLQLPLSLHLCCSVHYSPRSVTELSWMMPTLWAVWIDSSRSFCSVLFCSTNQITVIKVNKLLHHRTSWLCGRNWLFVKVLFLFFWFKINARCFTAMPSSLPHMVIKPMQQSKTVAGHWGSINKRLKKRFINWTNWSSFI